MAAYSLSHQAPRQVLRHSVPSIPHDTNPEPERAARYNSPVLLCHHHPARSLGCLPRRDSPSRVSDGRDFLLVAIRQAKVESALPLQ